MRRCGCYTDSAGLHLCHLHKESHVHTLEWRDTSAGPYLACIECGAVNPPEAR